MDDHTDYARRLILEPGALEREIERMSTASNRQEGAAPSDAAELRPGVSVIVPTYQGVDRIEGTIESLAAQDLDRQLFEVIVVANGPLDGTQERLASLESRFPTLQLRVFSLEEASAGNARNVALLAARKAYVTFVDDDDTVERRYLSALMEEAEEQTIVVAPIIDVNADGTEVPQNSLNVRIGEMRGRGGVSPAEVPWLFGFNACKLIPTSIAQGFRYDRTLTSGEDLVYMANMLTVPNLTARTIRQFEGAAYRRTLRQGSVSRRELHFGYAVADRVAVMKRLRQIEVSNAKSAAALDALIRAQAGFVLRYVNENPDEFDAVSDFIERAAVANFPWDIVNANRARHLAISYCFAPFSDTSAVVAAKAVAERARHVDIITCDMSSVRRTDPAVSALADRWISRRYVVESQPSFANWSMISDFGEKALKIAEREHALNGGYKTMYSRALWVGSHVAAAMFKLRHWSVTWTAEFSDPLRTDAEGRRRPGELTDNAVQIMLRQGIAARGYGHLNIETVFDLVEAATLVLADELIFTNSSQQSYMLNMLEDEQLRSLVRAKSIIREHPTPDAAAYEVAQTDYKVPEGVVNLAYFGSFYANRGLGDILTAIPNLPSDIRSRVRLHIFCNRPSEVRAVVATYGAAPNVYVQEYLPYMEFLNATRLFDVLVVNDVMRGPSMEINPFLPSKLSDYRGSGRSIWALVDDSSPLSRADVQYRSKVGDSAASASVLCEIVRERAASLNG